MPKPARWRRKSNERSRPCSATPNTTFRKASRATTTRSTTKTAWPRKRRNRTFLHTGGRAAGAAMATRKAYVAGPGGGAGPRAERLPERDRVLDAALRPQGVQVTLQAERREVPVEDLAVVAHRGDH